MKDLRKARCIDFQTRLASEEAPLWVHERSAECILVHPLASDALLLEQLSLEPSDCTSVDAYVRIEGDVIFFQAGCQSVWNRSEGTYARIMDDGCLNLVVLVDRDFIDEDLFRACLLRGLDLLEAAHTNFDGRLRRIDET